MLHVMKLDHVGQVGPFEASTKFIALRHFKPINYSFF